MYFHFTVSSWVCFRVRVYDDSKKRLEKERRVLIKFIALEIFHDGRVAYLMIINTFSILLWRDFSLCPLLCFSLCPRCVNCTHWLTMFDLRCSSLWIHTVGNFPFLCINVPACACKENFKMQIESDVKSEANSWYYYLLNALLIIFDIFPSLVVRFVLCFFCFVFFLCFSFLRPILYGVLEIASCEIGDRKK